ncbi:MAG: HAD family phosphatase [Clostridia bacterium]|nr:HAD family phosphatase [Clostridia bacterium]
MIKNIIFDLFGVIARFDTEGYYARHGISPGDQMILQREVFRSLEFAMGDRGAISEEAAIGAICARIPGRLHEAVSDFIHRQNRALLPIPGMEDLLQRLKDRGHRLFLLSNTSRAFHRFQADIPGIALFDGTLISADVGLVKPDPAIFRLACRQFGILPSESAFVDDTPINAEAAQYVGMKACVFNGDVKKLEQWLIEL